MLAFQRYVPEKSYNPVWNSKMNIFLILNLLLLVCNLSSFVILIVNTLDLGNYHTDSALTCRIFFSEFFLIRCGHFCLASRVWTHFMVSQKVQFSHNWRRFEKFLKLTNSELHRSWKFFSKSTIIKCVSKIF